MSNLGCSTRFVVILSIVLVALLLGSFVAGPLGAKLMGLDIPSSIQVSKPHVQLPSEPIFHVGGFAVTNTLLSSWITILLLSLLFWGATRKMSLIPGRMQSFAEMVVETAYNFILGVAGEKNSRTFFPIFTTIFLYVSFNAWLALIPIWGTIGIWEHGEEGAILVPILRAANTDVNLTLSIALVAFFFIEGLGISRMGPIKYIDGFFNFGQWKTAFAGLAKGDMKTFGSNFAFSVLNLFIGVLEIISHVMRIISFTFRLFGNMTAGEILIGVMTFLVPLVIAIPFYGLETLVGFLQAMIFAGLTLVWGTMAITPHHEEGEEHH